MSTVMNKCLILNGMLRPYTTDTTSNLGIRSVIYCLISGGLLCLVFLGGTDHDWLMIASVLGGPRLGSLREECSESSCQAWSTEFVVKASGADRGFQHDVKTRGIMAGPPYVNLPGLLVVWYQ